MSSARYFLALAFVAVPASPQVLAIHHVQGPSLRSPYEGQRVTVRGVVTGVTKNGFFIQDPAPDGDPQTSEGIFVYTGSTPPAEAAPGNLLEVRGEVREYVPTADPASPPLTELVNPSLTLLESQQPLPEPVLLSAALPAPTGSLAQLEPLEGMRVRIESLTVTEPTGGRIDEVSAQSTTSGVFFGVVTGTPRPFREPGFPPYDPIPSGDPPRFDGNPEVIRVDSACLAGSTPLDLPAGAVVENLQGPLTFASRRYTLCPELGFAVASLPPEPQPLSPPPPGELAVASWNLQRFYDDRDDPALAEPVLTAEAFERRLVKLVRAVSAYLRFPQVLVVQEVESERVLGELAFRLDGEALRLGLERPGYEAFLSPLGDPGGLRVGALVAQKLRGVEVAVRAAGTILEDAPFQNPNGTSERLFDRPPLLLRLAVRAPGRGWRELALLGVHLRSMNGLLSNAPGNDGWPTEGARVRAKRAAQGEELARWVDAWQRANPAVPVVILGDFNAFEFPDGVVDVVGTVAGSPASAGEVVLATRDLVGDDLVILTRRELPPERYSYVYDGSAQTLDHVLVSASLAQSFAPKLVRPRIAADFPDTARNTPSPFRLSDHDPLLLTLALPRTPIRRLTPTP
ncbi:MAG: endonuclease/exonuclease/phosphatase family protein [Thermoanaerobaculum sp.]